MIVIRIRQVVSLDRKQLCVKNRKISRDSDLVICLDRWSFWPGGRSGQVVVSSGFTVDVRNFVKENVGKFFQLPWQVIYLYPEVIW